MAQVLIRDLDDDLVEKLKERAKHHHRSLQSELKLILAQAARVSYGDTAKTAARLRKKLAGRKHSDSAELIAEDRGR